MAKDFLDSLRTISLLITALAAALIVLSTSSLHSDLDVVARTIFALYQIPPIGQRPDLPDLISKYESTRASALATARQRIAKSFRAGNSGRVFLQQAPAEILGLYADTGQPLTQPPPILQAELNFLLDLYHRSSVPPDPNTLLDSIFKRRPAPCRPCTLSVRNEGADAVEVTYTRALPHSSLRMDTLSAVHVEFRYMPRFRPVASAASALIENIFLRDRAFADLDTPFSEFGFTELGHARDSISQLVALQDDPGIVWFPIRLGTRAEAISLLETYKAKFLEGADVAGLKVPSYRLSWVGPALLIVLLTYTGIHLVRLLTFPKRDLAAMRLYPWAPLFPGALGWVSTVGLLLVLPLSAAFALVYRVLLEMHTTLSPRPSYPWLPLVLTAICTGLAIWCSVLTTHLRTHIHSASDAAA